MDKELVTLQDILFKLSATVIALKEVLDQLVISTKP